ncbi:hypothetical protein HGM15179_018797 [Zosterops borbonicus]|uniref:Uncharacterized protein n=1 Tax=Zosterops borbonicus TaxID=364589 RepID=A0A8K1DBH4_9PASS|nr:hypothetical protein HGM15179_018797 [Zosterops borbonicus]
MGPGKVTTTGGGKITARESPQEVTQGWLQASATGSAHDTSHGDEQPLLTSAADDIVALGWFLGEEQSEKP